jgi:hypothetical protein
VPNLEHVVRPLQSINIRPAGRNTSEPVVAPDDVVLLFGGSGSDVFTLNQTVKDQVNNKRDDVEIQRTFDVVRIKNPDDDEQHVDVEVMTGLKARSQIDKGRTQLRFSKPESSGNIEVLRRNQTRDS